MNMNKQDRKSVENEAKDRGYRQSSTDPNKMVKDDGKSIKFSESGGSVKTDRGDKYTSSSDAKKSNRW